MQAYASTNFSALDLPVCLCFFLKVWWGLASRYYVCCDIQKKISRTAILFQLIFLNVIVIFDRWVILQRPDNNSDPFDPKGKLHFHFIFFYLCFSVLGSQGGGGRGRIAPLYKCPHMACIFFNYNHSRLVKFWPVIPLHFNESTLLLFVARILYSSNVLQSLAIH